VLPTGFMRIRYYGFLANRHRAEKLHRVRLLLQQSSSNPDSRSFTEIHEPHGIASDEPGLCPRCKQGRLLTVSQLRNPLGCPQPWRLDSS
jgi:hypothetical protein